MQQKTIRVRIAVCVTIGGEWYAAGGGNMEDDEAADSVSEYMDARRAVHFIEADIPLPQTIVAEVKS